MPAAKTLMALGGPVGTLVMDPDFAVKLLNDGCTFVACGQDTTLLAQATDAALATVKAQIVP